MKRKFHVRCEVGEKLEIISNIYLSLLLDIASTAILITFVVGCVSEAIKALSNLV